MPRDGAITFGDLVGKIDLLEVACAKCGRKGRYAVARLIEQCGADAKVADLLDELAAQAAGRQLLRPVRCRILPISIDSVVRQ